MITSEKNINTQQERRSGQETPKKLKREESDKKTRSRPHEIQRHVKREQVRSSLFKFIFSEYKRIRDFGRDTHILYPKMLPPGIQLNRDIHIPFTKYMQPQAIELYQALTHILKKQWSQLEKKEYNLCVILRKLCEKLALTNFNLLNYDDRNLIDRLRAVEAYFLVLHSNPDFPDLLIKIVTRTLEKDTVYKNKREELTYAIRKILLSDVEMPSLFNFLLGLNMLKYRRYLRFKDIITRNGDEIISSEVFECEEDIQREINAFVDECKKNLVFLAGKKREIERIKRFLPVDECGEIDYTMLKYLYDSSHTDEKHQFNMDQENVLQFTLQLLLMFQYAFKNLLCSKVNIFGKGMSRIFPHGFFRVEFDKIENLIEQISEVSYAHTNPVSYTQYLVMRKMGKKASKQESGIILLIDETSTLLYAVGKKIADFLKNSEREDETGNKIGTHRDIGLSVPLNTKIKTGKPGLSGNTLEEALTFVVNISFLINHLFRGRFTYMLLSKETMIENEINLKMAMLKRVADSRVYEKLKELCS
jgi:hypothetical protein